MDMKKGITAALILLSILFFSCQEEEVVSQRNYPFVESLGITDINQTGVTVNFEILKNGRASIDEYGVEFLEADLAKSGEPNLVFLKSSQSGAPDDSRVEWRISYDLFDNEEYVVKPFVRMGNTVVYGQNLVFDSQGVNPPVISEVTPTEIYQVNQLTIKGDFFNSKIENNKVEIPGLENAYLSILNSVSPNELQVTFLLRNASSIDPKRKYDLRITSANKSTVVSDVFTIVLPKIEQISPISSFVGETVDIKLNQLTGELGGLGFKLYNSTHSFDFSPKAKGSGLFQTVWPNVPAGRYKISVSINGYTNEFNSEIEILKSWEVYRENLPYSSSGDWVKAFVGDKLLLWRPSSPELRALYSYDPILNILSLLNPIPNDSPKREFPLIQSVNDRFLYYGLGTLYNQPYLSDFYRFDIELNLWESMAEYPFKNSSISKSFEFQGKIYLVVANEPTFITYDLISNSWTRTGITVPEGMNSSIYLDASDRGIFYVPRVGNIKLIKYIPGLEEESFIEEPYNFVISNYLIRILEDKLFIFNGSENYFQVNLDTREITNLQTIEGINNIRATPWATSQGLLMVFPIRQDQNLTEDRIYKLLYNK